MRTVHTFLLIWTVIVHSTEHSSQADRNSHNERDPDLFPSAGEQHTPDQNSPETLPSRTRSRSPARTSTFSILGYPLEKLGYLRLIPRTNERLRFEFRSFVFATDNPITLRTSGKKYSSVPAQQHIVLSTTNGDIFAILGDSGFLRAIYRRDRYHSRIKMNMNSGAIDNLTPDEMRDCPVGNMNPIFPHSFIRAFGNYNSLNSEQNPNDERNSGSSPPTRHQSPERTSPQVNLPRERSMHPPGGPPSDGVLGMTKEELGYVRLISRTHDNRQFEFRRHVFALDKRIRMRIDGKTYMFEPTREYIVVSASNGDVFAILDYSGTLRAIYSTDKSHSRVKINMISGAVENLTPDEVKNCPVGKSHPIFPTSFIQAFDNHNTLQPEQNPNAEHNPGTSARARQHSSDRISPKKAPFRARSKSPSRRPPAHEVLGYELSELGYIRLIPNANPNRRFEFRRYYFLDDNQVRMKINHKVYAFEPTTEYIVLSTSNGEIFAILECTGILRGIYSIKTNHGRMKINIMSGEAYKMTETEMKECHVGENYSIFPRWFDKVFSNEDSLQHVYH